MMTTQSTSNQQGMAIGALILAILSLFIPYVGLILAIVALVMAAKVTTPEQRGLIIATKVISWISVIWAILFIILLALGVMSTFV
ncbi:DUF4190 domain-containing protein [Alkalicoccobacillus porphyridii]|uniref:DUF4190 domain-containing protein n=1 Tax=Alkalicoccobacillus porphyridii TaxID=2597270 RepID=A0A554A0L2_9BACI|nr:DUF4190 domain-containing protein [Alkalicoccobacillus porphyridii]TSB47232.1 DUF4190 domain-containing protein [Alkalicoccobacillus porphyridii]